MTAIHPDVAEFLDIVSLGLGPGEQRLIPTCRGDLIPLVVHCVDLWRFTTVQYRAVSGISYPSPGVEWRRRPGNCWQPIALHIGHGFERRIHRVSADHRDQDALNAFCNRWLLTDLHPHFGGRSSLEAGVYRTWPA